MRLLILLVVFGLGLPVAGTAAVFQYAAEFSGSKSKPIRAHLWIPPQADRVRGLVVCGATLMESSLVKDETIRDACGEQDLGLLYLSRGLGEANVAEMLGRFAERSGYGELAHVPLVFVGHSAGGPQAMRLAQEMAERCFGVIQYRGGIPNAENPAPPGIPAMVMLGQFDEFGGTMRDANGVETWERGLDGFAGFRGAGPDHLGTLVVEPGAGHFAWSQRNADWVALFLGKAAGALPRDWDGRAPPRLERPDEQSGWLTTLSPKGEIECARFAGFQGDRARTSWHFDEAMARASVRYHEGLTGKEDQFIRWADRYWVDAGARFFFLKPEWQGDGSFVVHPEFAATYPEQHKGQGPKWPRAGDPVGNCGGPIRIRSVGGPLVADGEAAMRIEFDALNAAGGRGGGTFMAYNEGGPKHRHTEQVGMLPRGFEGHTKGRQQAITFPQPADMTAKSGSIDLNATSDAGLPVHYYVAHGPAVIVDGTLSLDEVPKRARFPIEVEVVAWQFGRGIEPFVKTAGPVARQFRITAP